MNDKQLNAALRSHSKAWHKYLADPANRGEEPVLPTQVRAAINEVRAEARRRVRDSGGPLSDYSDALSAWAAANHPDIDSYEMYRHITSDLIRDHR